MKIEIIRETLKNKSLNKEFALITNLINGESEIFFPGNNHSGMFSKYSEEIEKIFHSNKNGIIENSEIFVQTYKNPIKVIIVGAVDISIYLIEFAKNLLIDIPAEAVRPVSFLIRLRISLAISDANSIFFLLTVTSKNASSKDRGSIKSV